MTRLPAWIGFCGLIASLLVGGGTRTIGKASAVAAVPAAVFNAEEDEQVQGAGTSRSK